jgi:SnoaL-like domain
MTTLASLLAMCQTTEPPVDQSELHDFARRYTAAWCSQNPPSVAAFYEADGTLAINGGAPNVGRDAIAESARSFMTAFPDLVVAFDRLEPLGDAVRYHWTLSGTNTGPDGTGRPVRVSGYEEWTMGRDGLVAHSVGYFDADDFERQRVG